VFGYSDATCDTVSLLDGSDSARFHAIQHDAGDALALLLLDERESRLALAQWGGASEQSARVAGSLADMSLIGRRST
jgi:hypothetical protein